MQEILDAIVQVITNVGFPIAMCLLLFYYMTKQNEKFNEILGEIKEAINQNTTAIARLEILLDENKE